MSGSKPTRAKLDQQIAKVDLLLLKLEAAHLNPIRILTASLASHERRQKVKNPGTGRATT